MSVARILVIAGSDSGGGAGIQADIKTVMALGGHAMTAVTALTAQNTLGVTRVMPVAADMVLAQIDAVADDIGVDAVKIGMIGSAAVAHAVADRLERLGDVPIVFDPVMVATSGSVLADPETIAAFARLMAMATVTTPNLPELAALSGTDDSAAGAERLVARHGRAVLAKGGHGAGAVLVDRLHAADGVTTWTGARMTTRHTHGTGCTLASGIATGLGQGLPLVDAVTVARDLVRRALLAAPGLGEGHGPMGHGLSPVMRFNQATVTVRDYGAAVAFYTALGLERIVDAPPRYARFETGGGATLSIHVDPAAAASATMLYFECDDLDMRVERLSAAGIAIESGPREESWGWREARLRDPAGNPVCLYRAGTMRRFPPWRVRDMPDDPALKMS